MLLNICFVLLLMTSMESFYQILLNVLVNTYLNLVFIVAALFVKGVNWISFLTFTKSKTL